MVRLSSIMSVQTVSGFAPLQSSLQTRDVKLV